MYLVVVKSSMNNINRVVVTFLRRGTIKAESVLTWRNLLWF